MPTPTRSGKPLTQLPPGDRRRLSDGRNAWRKMSPEQRRLFLDWIAVEGLEVAPRPEIEPGPPIGAAPDLSGPPVPAPPADDTLYRVLVRSTASLQPGGGSATHWQREVIYCGPSLRDARIAYTRSEPDDCWRGYGNGVRETHLQQQRGLGKWTPLSEEVHRA